MLKKITREFDIWECENCEEFVFDEFEDWGTTDSFNCQKCLARLCAECDMVEEADQLEMSLNGALCDTCYSQKQG